jgi:hypothetical protein
MYKLEHERRNGEELIRTEVKIKEYGDRIFNLYLNNQTLNIWARECHKVTIKGKVRCQSFQFRVRDFISDDEFKDLYRNNKANIECGLQYYKHEYLTSRLESHAKDEEVSIADMFMFGHYDQITW